MESKPARFALQPSPLAVLCSDLDLDMDDAAEILDISYAQVRYYVEHTREFTSEAWLEIASLLMTTQPTQRISIFEFLDDEDARISQAYRDGGQA